MPRSRCFSVWLAAHPLAAFCRWSRDPLESFFFFFFFLAADESNLSVHVCKIVLFRKSFRHLRFTRVNIRTINVETELFRDFVNKEKKRKKGIVRRWTTGLGWMFRASAFRPRFSKMLQKRWKILSKFEWIYDRVRRSKLPLYNDVLNNLYI